MSGAWAVYWRELLLLRRRLRRHLTAMTVSPLLYLIAFGYAMGQSVRLDGHSYLQFLLPGLAAMTGMTQAFAIAGEINIARFYWHTFEELQAAPLSPSSYVAGEVLAGITRALLATGVILGLGLLFGVRLSLGPGFWLAAMLNGLVFAALGVCLAMVVRSHNDQMLLNNFIITPMAFLGGIFFPLERMPTAVQIALQALPITHASRALRQAALTGVTDLHSCALLLITGLALLALAVRCVRKAKN